MRMQTAIKTARESQNALCAFHGGQLWSDSLRRETKACGFTEKKENDSQRAVTVGIILEVNLYFGFACLFPLRSLRRS